MITHSRLPVKGNRVQGKDVNLRQKREPFDYDV
jgi:hypothetical protein